MPRSDAIEANFDGLIGPTHNYAGLSAGNLASGANRHALANPRAAALQGLAKMRRLHQIGLVQGFIPPHQRPHLPTLRALGFAGSDAAIVQAAHRADPALLATVYSAAGMWVANAATVCPSADAADGRLHLTPANLAAMPHRAIEPAQTALWLRTIFPQAVHHRPVPASWGDEGAANHCRMAPQHGAPGVQLFVYGRADGDAPLRYPARQAARASEAVARQHGVRAVLLARQAAAAIEAGAFHNDVVAVANETVMLCHEQALEPGAIERLRSAGADTGAFHVVRTDQVSLRDAVRSYLFNSQLVTLPGGGMALILPEEAAETHSTRRYLDDLLAEGGAIRELHYVSLRESMRNGGGPACLRLRVVLTPAELAAVDRRFLLEESDRLEAWVTRHYRDRLAPEDLADPALMQESFAALDALTQLLGLGAVYDFQR